MSRKGRSPSFARRSDRTKTARRPTKELARTWLVTVINPVIQGLRKEKVWLLRRSWTWRHSTATFEYLWPLEAYVSPVYSDNLSAFLRWYPEAEGSFRDHDAALGTLAAAAQGLFNRLLEAREFTAAVSEADANAARADVNLEEAHGAVAAEQWPRLLAEYLINNVRSLADYYTTAAYWRVAGEGILHVRDAESLREPFAALDLAGDMLLQATERAGGALRAIRERYTERFGLPPVPIVGEPEAREG